MYLGLRIAELKTQLQLNELARDGTRGEGRADGPQKKGAKEERSWARVAENGGGWPRGLVTRQATLGRQYVALAGDTRFEIGEKIGGIDFPLTPRSARCRGIDRSSSSCRRSRRYSLVNIYPCRALCCTSVSGFLASSRFN